MSGIVAIRLQLEQGAEFDEIARNISECRSAAKGGDLGYFSRGQMQKSFEDATFALSVGELSQPVVSDSGVHLIMRTA
jgi:parvulin-like peptidyl-prolyl isomerase